VVTARAGLFAPPDAKLPEQDRKDFARVLEVLRVYVSGNGA